MNYTLADYLFFRGGLDYTAAPVNEIDEMVFASLGKADYTGILAENDTAIYADAFNAFFALHGEQEDEALGLLESPILMKTLRTISRCSRYANIAISHFVNKVSPEDTEQMSALTVHGPNGKLYITYRGTDDTLIGWKENCELAILDSVPAQRDAAAYLETVAAQFPGPIVVSGHSKGGNLAVYAAVNARKDIRDRIEKVISYDGPGFLNDFFKQPGYLDIEDKIMTIVPNASLIGMLMRHARRLDVVDCKRDGPLAHDIFLWNLLPSGFKRTRKLSEKSEVFHHAIDQTLKKLDMQKRQELVDEIFDVLSSTGADNLLDFTEHSAAQALKLSIRAQKSKEIKQFFLMLSRFFAKDTMNNTLGELQEKVQGKLIEPVKGKIEKKKTPNKQ